MLGSVTDIIVRDSRLPVLLVSSRRKLKVARGAARSSEPSTKEQARAVGRSVHRLVKRDTSAA